MVTSWKQEQALMLHHAEWRNLWYWPLYSVCEDPQIILNCNLDLSTESEEINDKGYHGDHGNSFAESQQPGAQFKSCTQPVL